MTAEGWSKAVETVPDAAPRPLTRSGQRGAPWLGRLPHALRTRRESRSRPLGSPPQAVAKQGSEPGFTRAPPSPHGEEPRSGVSNHEAAQKPSSPSASSGQAFETRRSDAPQDERFARPNIFFQLGYLASTRSQWLFVEFFLSELGAKSTFFLTVEEAAGDSGN